MIIDTVIVAVSLSGCGGALDNPGAGGASGRDAGRYCTSWVVGRGWAVGRRGIRLGSIGLGAGERADPGRAERTAGSLVRHCRPGRSSAQPPGPGGPVRAAAPAAARGSQAPSGGRTVASRDPGRAGGRDRREAGRSRPRPGYSACVGSIGGTGALLGAAACAGGTACGPGCGGTDGTGWGGAGWGGTGGVAGRRGAWRRGGAGRRGCTGRDRARGQARAGGDAAARRRGPRAGPGRCAGNPECRGAAAGGARSPPPMRR